MTSIIYRDHGICRTFSGQYEEYFGDLVDEDAVTYLQLVGYHDGSLMIQANHLVHQFGDIGKAAEMQQADIVTIAGDVSGCRSLALSTAEGGIGFDYRWALGASFSPVLAELSDS